MAKEQLVRIGSVDDFPMLLGKEVRIGDYDIAVFRTSDGGWYALDNHTPHKKGGPLTEAIVSGHTIYCPLRDLHIRLVDGRVMGPDTGEVRTFRVIVDGDAVGIELPPEA
ncbi:nitrite reductase small subunit NirD [Paenibacillus chartarius]|uniref:Nitrite reductase small subunit NirD n=1 Tax=Paenibacillus chartarius TaxID=747481 RepID=A0ABV6DHS0_9BACL